MSLQKDEQPAVEPAPSGGVLERWFTISARGSTVGREVRGGLATFFTMAYIVVLNPMIIGTQADSTGGFLGGGDAPNLPMVAAATALVAGRADDRRWAWWRTTRSRSPPGSASTRSSRSASPSCRR